MAILLRGMLFCLLRKVVCIGCGLSEVLVRPADIAYVRLDELEQQGQGMIAPPQSALLNTFCMVANLHPGCRVKSSKKLHLRPSQA